MCADVDELRANLKNNPGDYTDAERADLEKAIEYNWPMLEQYIDEEMGRIGESSSDRVSGTFKRTQDGP